VQLSTWTRTIIIVPPLRWKNTAWSTSQHENPRCHTMISTSCWYQRLPDCFKPYKVFWRRQTVTTRLVVVFTLWKSCGIDQWDILEYDKGGDVEGESTTNYEW
jgi:hypothetical protein